MSNVIINSWIFHCPQPTVEWQLNTTGRIKKKKHADQGHQMSQCHHWVLWLSPLVVTQILWLGHSLSISPKGGWAGILVSNAAARGGGTVKLWGLVESDSATGVSDIRSLVVSQPLWAAIKQGHPILGSPTCGWSFPVSAALWCSLRALTRTQTEWAQ